MFELCAFGWTGNGDTNTSITAGKVEGIARITGSNAYGSVLNTTKNIYLKSNEWYWLHCKLGR